jgi:acetyl-CoA carboxylase carboxyl transferase subunit beta
MSSEVPKGHAQDNRSLRKIVDPHFVDLSEVGYEAGISHPTDRRIQDLLPRPSHETISRAVTVAGSVARSVERTVAPQVRSVVDRIVSHTSELPPIDPDSVFTEIESSIHFQEKDASLRLAPEGLEQAYKNRLGRAEAKSGYPSAAKYGTGSIEENPLVFYRTVWDFMGGSTGAVEGEKFMRAIDLAIDLQAPFLACYATGGMRQDENFAALEQLRRMVEGRDHFARTSKEVSVAYFAHKVYGGNSVESSIADILVGREGTQFGFAGPNVIHGFEGKPPEAGSQSAEVTYQLRKIDYLVKDEGELLNWMSRLMCHTKESRGLQLGEEQLQNLSLRGGIPDSVRFPFDTLGYSSVINDASEEEGESMGKNAVDIDDQFARYNAHRTNPSRPDTDYIVRQICTDVVPFYNRFSDGKFLKYPAIIFALGKIGGKTILIGGDQASYQKMSTGNVVKIPASPTPDDLEYFQRMMSLGERMGVPVVLLTDIFGANSTIASEQRGQARAIGQAMRAGVRYSSPVISINHGVLGSGGGMVTYPRGEGQAIVKNGFNFVAEALSSARIMLKKSTITDDEGRAHLRSMHATADDMYEKGYVDTVIEEPEGAWINPLAVTKNIQDYIAECIIVSQDKTPQVLFEERRRASRGSSSLPFQE